MHEENHASMQAQRVPKARQPALRKDQGSVAALRILRFRAFGSQATLCSPQQNSIDACLADAQKGRRQAHCCALQLL